MEMIITRSGLSTGAVYGYFKGNGEIISAVVTDGTAAMGRQFALVLRNPEPLRLPQFTDQMLRAIADFGQDKHDGIDRLLVALHGWSHSQSDPGLKGPHRHPGETLPSVGRFAARGRPILEASGLADTGWTQRRSSTGHSRCVATWPRMPQVGDARLPRGA
jgi:AcrR family transcriptional regulator